MIEKIENAIISNLVYYHLIEDDEIEIYRFGVECYILKVIHYLTYCLIAFLCGSLFEFFIFIVSYLLLRKYAGGIHANTRTGCFVISDLILFGVLIVGQSIERSEVLSVITFISLLSIILFAPVDNPNRVLSNEERNKFKKYAFYICILELSVICIGTGIKGEYSKWIQFGIIVSACMTICGRIKYFCISHKGIKNNSD